MQNLTGKGKFYGYLIKTKIDLIQIVFEKHEYDQEKVEISQKFIGK